MHAVLIRFSSSVPLTDLAAPFRDYAEALRELPGLAAKTWIANGTEVGGFHVFDDERAARAYLDGALFGSVRDNPAFDGFIIDHFEVLEELSVWCGRDDRGRVEHLASATNAAVVRVRSRAPR